MCVWCELEAAAAYLLLGVFGVGVCFDVLGCVVVVSCVCCVVWFSVVVLFCGGCVFVLCFETTDRVIWAIYTQHMQ